MKVFYLTIILFFTFSAKAQQFADKEFYLVDSLDLSTLPDNDIHLLDSVLNLFHNEIEDTAKANHISELVARLKSYEAPVLYNDWQILFIKEKLKTEVNPTKIEVFDINLAFTYKSKAFEAVWSGDMKTAQKYFEEAYTLLSKTGNKAGIASALNNLAALNIHIHHPLEAIKYLDKAVIAYQDAGMPQGAGNCYLNYAVIYTNYGELDKCLEYRLKALKVWTDLERVEDIAQVKSSIGSVYLELGDYKKSYQYYQEAIKILKKQSMYDPLVIAYLGMAAWNENQGKYDAAREQLYEAINISEKWGLELHLSKIYKQLSNVYLLENKLDSARLNIEKSIAISRKTEHDADLCFALISLAKIQVHQKLFKEAELSGEEALKIAKNLNEWEELQQASWALNEIYQKTSKWKKAVEMQNLYLNITDSLEKDDVIKNTLKQALQYEYDKEKQDAELVFQKQLIVKQEQNERQKLITYGVVLGLILILIFAIFIYDRLRKSKRQQRIIEEQALKLQELDETKTKFFNNVAHELRTPLTLMTGHMESMLNERFGGLNENQRKSVQVAKNNSSRLMELVSEILDLGKLESNKLELNVKPTAIKPFLDRLFFTFESLAYQFEIELEYNYNISENLSLAIDDKKIEKAINNLVYNAIKFTPRGGKVIMTVEENEAHFLIKVKDTGRGIPKEELHLVFERYFQSTNKDAPAQGGTGIGLTIVKEFIELHGGEVSLTSELGKGTQFTISLPRALKTTDTSVLNQELNEKVKEEYPNYPILKGKNATILVVEDHKEMQQYLKDILSDYAKVLIANDGTEALTLLENNKVDIATIDVMMPNMDGFTLLKKIKENQTNYQLPIIMLTARSAEEDKLDALRIGVNDYITKPFNQQELVARVANLLENKIARETAKDEALDLHKDDEFLNQLNKIVLEHLVDSNFNVTDLAEKNGVSEKQLTRNLKRITGLTPLKFIREIKLLKAQELLKAKTFYTVAEVCYAVGFEKPSYFTQIFIARFGKKPSDYIG